ASPETWIYRIAIHSALRVRRRRRRHRELDAQATPRRSSPRQDALADPGTIEQREQARRVHEAMDHLSETHRVVLSLQALRGMSPATIATILVVPVGTVHSRAHAARKRLRELLEGSTIMNSAEDEDSAKPRATRHADDPRLQPSETTPNRASLVTPSRATGGVNRS
ncbi:MAG: RNA polymerase sigma factor, partial [Planctomycetota bacterium]